ncbi:MAG: LysR family transcriptional regulator [Xanthobacteraceae bacterium]
MHSRLLRHFLGVVEKRNITAAAEALNISQPALTRSIRQLEKTIGVTLFERLPSGVALTKPGEVLARRVKLMELEYRHALSEISALEQGMTGVLRIAAGPMWVAMILPDVITAFHQQFPKVKLRVTEGAIDSIVPALMAGEIDLACVTLSFPSQPELVKEPLVGVRHALVARANHPLAGKGVVKAEDLARYPWAVLANDSVGTGRIGSYLVANGLGPPQIAIEATSIGMLRVLECSNFLGLFSTAMVDFAKRFGLVTIPHEGTFWEAEAGLAYLRTNRPPKSLESFKSRVRAALSG